MRTQMNVPLEYVEAEIADQAMLKQPAVIEDIEFDGLSGVVVVTVDVEGSEAHKLPWIDADPDVIGVPV